MSFNSNCWLTYLLLIGDPVPCNPEGGVDIFGLGADARVVWHPWNGAVVLSVGSHLSFQHPIDAIVVRLHGSCKQV